MGMSKPRRSELKKTNTPPPSVNPDAGVLVFTDSDLDGEGPPYKRAITKGLPATKLAAIVRRFADMAEAGDKGAAKALVEILRVVDLMTSKEPAVGGDIVVEFHGVDVDAVRREGGP